jgi:hypothetical protein
LLAAKAGEATASEPTDTIRNARRLFMRPGLYLTVLLH